MTVLGLSPSKAHSVDQGSKNGLQQTQHEMSEDAKKLAAKALAAAKNAAAVASGRGKVEVIQTVSITKPLFLLLLHNVK
jgi:hypothetical protein